MAEELPIFTLRIVAMDDGQALSRCHLIDVWVSGIRFSKITAIIATEPGTLPRVYRYIELGNLELTAARRDQLLLACFERIEREQLKFGWDSDRADVPNAATWLSHLLPADDASSVIHEIAHRLDPNVLATEAAWSFHSPPSNRDE